jgi:cobalt/nickel transport protein
MHAVKCSIASFLCLVVSATALPSHEFWIDPERYQVEIDGRILADFRNGQEFEGITLGFFDRSSALLRMALRDDVRDLEPRNGDRPAIDQAPMGEGLHILLHETTPQRLTYATWEKFAAFAAHKDFPDIEARHAARGLPRKDFAERYTRHVKALVAVGDGAGSDRRFGLETEFVALANPYTPEFAQEMAVELYYDGALRADAQVEIFDMAADGSVSIRLARTNDRGVARFGTEPGHTYLVDAVVLREPELPGDVAWESLWAALTFAVPGA